MICSDFAPEMIEVARRLGAESSLDNVEYRVLDAERMDLDDESVDVILCRSALMIMADPRAALVESRRVLRPGGVLACSVFTTPAENPWVLVPIQVFIERGLIERPDPSGPGMFALGIPPNCSTTSSTCFRISRPSSKSDPALVKPPETSYIEEPLSEQSNSARPWLPN